MRLMDKRRAVKGEYGYLKAQMKREIFKTALFFALAALFLILGILIMKNRDPSLTLSQSRNNLLTIGAVLFILPGAKFLVSTVMFAKALKYATPADIRDRVIERNEAAAFDVYLTSYQQNFPMHAVVCGDNEIAGLSADPGIDENAAKEHILQILKKDGIKNVTVKIFKDADRFTERIGSMGVTEEALEKSQRLRTLILDVSL